MCGDNGGGGMCVAMDMLATRRKSVSVGEGWLGQGGGRGKGAGSRFYALREGRVAGPECPQHGQHQKTTNQPVPVTTPGAKACPAPPCTQLHAHAAR